MIGCGTTIEKEALGVTVHIYFIKPLLKFTVWRVYRLYLKFDRLIKNDNVIRLNFSAFYTYKYAY